MQGGAIILALGFILYSIGTLFWAFSLQYEQFSTAVAFFTILNLLMTTVIGVTLFQDSLSLTNKIGIVCCFVSIILLEA